MPNAKAKELARGGEKKLSETDLLYMQRAKDLVDKEIEKLKGQKQEGLSKSGQRVFS